MFYGMRYNIELNVFYRKSSTERQLPSEYVVNIEVTDTKSGYRDQGIKGLHMNPILLGPLDACLKETVHLRKIRIFF